MNAEKTRQIMRNTLLGASEPPVGAKRVVEAWFRASRVPPMSTVATILPFVRR